MAKEIKNENAEAVAEAVSKTDKFFKENGKALTIVTVVILLAVAGIFCWHKFAYEPAQKEALGQMAYAEQAFANGNYELALNGDGNRLGFNEIIDQYGAKAGQAVYLYAGICELQLGNYDLAIENLKSYKGKDAILKARALACIGDCYVELENYEKALSYFEKAAGVVDNMFAAGYLLKAGLVAEHLGKKEKALEFYNLIKDEYPTTPRGADIVKYISRVEAK